MNIADRYENRVCTCGHEKDKHKPSNIITLTIPPRRVYLDCTIKGCDFKQFVYDLAADVL